MTDEEKMNAYYKQNICKCCLYSCKCSKPFTECVEYLFARNLYFAGLAEGRKEKWHDLRNNPDDLPEECQNVLCLCSDIGCKHYCTGHLIYKTWFSNIVSEKLRVIAWCELPKFEE